MTERREDLDELEREYQAKAKKINQRCENRVKRITESHHLRMNSLKTNKVIEVSEMINYAESFYSHSVAFDKECRRRLGEARADMVAAIHVSHGASRRNDGD